MFLTAAAMGNTGTHIANATDDNIKIFCKKSKLELQDTTVDIGGEICIGLMDTHAKATTASTLNFARSKDVSIQFIPARDYIDCPAFEVMFVTGKTDNGYLFQNYKAVNLIEQPRSFIITANKAIKYAKSGEIWVDDQGKDHKPKTAYDVSTQIKPITEDKEVQMSEK